MASKLEPIIYRDWQNGMLDGANNYMHPDNYAFLILNGYSDESYGNKLGNIKQIPGCTVIGSAIIADKNILGLTNLLTSGATIDRLIKTVNNDLNTNSLTYYWNGATWAEVGAVPTSWTVSQKMRFTSFLDYIFAANSIDPIRTWNGDQATSWGTTNAISAPTGNLISNYLSRVNIAGNNSQRSRLYYSSFPTSATPATITWSGSYVDFNPGDNDAITALEVNGSNLLVFKNRSIFTWNGFQTQPDALIDIGTVNQEVVKTIKGITFFFAQTYNKGGVFIYTGEYPKEISRSIQGWMNALSTAYFADFGAWKDEDAYYLSVGDLFKDSVLYSNVVFRYCVSKGTWTVLSMPFQPLVGAIRIQTTGTATSVFGDDKGRIITWGEGNTFSGLPVSTLIRTKEMEFGSRRKIKEINAFTVYSKEPGGASVRVRINGGQWQNIGRVTKTIQEFNVNLVGNYFEFEVGKSNTDEPWIFEGFEFEDVSIKPYD